MKRFNGRVQLPFHFYFYGDYRMVFSLRRVYSIFSQSNRNYCSCQRFSMNQTPSSYPRRSWRELYTAALFESDTDRIPTRISEAEQAIVARARELFAAGTDTIEEDQALDDALYALRALNNCLEFRAAA
jgi:hypothetical protein